jgi:hypothetical protein
MQRRQLLPSVLSYRAVQNAPRGRTTPRKVALSEFDGLYPKAPGKFTPSRRREAYFRISKLT